MQCLIHSLAENKSLQTSMLLLKENLLMNLEGKFGNYCYLGNIMKG